jgi:hypothetical protein
MNRSGGQIMKTRTEIRQAILENAEKMADALARGKDLEIRTSKSGISVAEITKKVTVR